MVIACAFYGDHGLFDDYTGGKRPSSATTACSPSAKGLDEAAFWFIAMDRCCQSQLLAEAAGAPVPIADDAAAHTARQVGSHTIGWFNFQPLYDMIVRRQPDLLAA